MEERYWYVEDDGRTIHWGEESDVLRYHPNAIRVHDRPDEFHIWDPKLKDWVKDPKAYIRQRVQEYPGVGDQLDALLKQLAYMRDSEKMPTVPDLDSLIKKWEAVKEKYPKG